MKGKKKKKSREKGEDTKLQKTLQHGNNRRKIFKIIYYKKKIKIKKLQRKNNFN